MAEPARAAVTLADVAARAGVSLNTVSRALRAPHTVRPPLRRRIEEVLDELNYVPNRLAGGLAGSQTGVVGVILTSLFFSEFAAVVDTLQAELAAAGFSVMLGNSRYDPEEELRLVRAMLSWRPAAMALVGIDRHPRAAELLQSAGIPVIEVWDMAGVAVIGGRDGPCGDRRHADPTSPGAGLPAAGLHRLCARARLPRPEAAGRLRAGRPCGGSDADLAHRAGRRPSRPRRAAGAAGPGPASRDRRAGLQQRRHRHGGVARAARPGAGRDRRDRLRRQRGRRLPHAFAQQHPPAARRDRAPRRRGHRRQDRRRARIPPPVRGRAGTARQQRRAEEKAHDRQPAQHHPDHDRSAALRHHQRAGRLLGADAESRSAWSRKG